MTRVGYDEASWIEGTDENGLPFFTDHAFQVFLMDAMRGPEKGLDSLDYLYAREALWAVSNDQ